MQVDGGFGYRFLGDARHDAEARRQLSKQDFLVRLAAIDGDSRGQDGRGGPGRQRSGAADRCSCWFAVGHAFQSRQRDVAGTYEISDMPAIHRAVLTGGVVYNLCLLALAAGFVLRVLYLRARQRRERAMSQRSDRS